MRCPSCNKDNPADASFCEQCGARLELQCPSCKALVSLGARFCKKCGAAIAKGPTPSAPSLPESIKLGAETAMPEEIHGERKTVTALFADIKGSMELMKDIDPEEARSIADPALKLMIDAAHRYDGYIVQSTGDGVFAIFGAPMAHEDHPQRALYAALRIQDEMRRYSARLREAGHLPIEARVGVDTGHSMSLANRMQVLAPIGSIATTERLRKLCEGYFLFESLGPTRVKGVTEHVHVYEVTGLGPLRTPLQCAARRGLTKFVGRQWPRGGGKSRLFFEFRARNQSGWKVLEAISFSHGKASVYMPVVGLLNTYFGIDTDDDTRNGVRRLTAKSSLSTARSKTPCPTSMGFWN